MSGPSEPADLRLPEDARQQVRDRVEETFDDPGGKRSPASIAAFSGAN
jgi:hypothetical protein